jgi:hypothetical protein
MKSLERENKRVAAVIKWDHGITNVTSYNYDGHLYIAQI